MSCIYPRIPRSTRLAVPQSVNFHSNRTRTERVDLVMIRVIFCQRGPQFENRYATVFPFSAAEFPARVLFARNYFFLLLRFSMLPRSRSNFTRKPHEGLYFARNRPFNPVFGIILTLISASVRVCLVLQVPLFLSRKK